MGTNPPSVDHGQHQTAVNSASSAGQFQHEIAAYPLLESSVGGYLRRQSVWFSRFRLKECMV